jgi:UDP-2,3-diacylglucosamine hydrolase
VVDDAVIKYASKHSANIVIHGHTHRPNLYQISTPNGIISRYEIPDWADHKPGGYIILDNESIEIHRT